MPFFCNNSRQVLRFQFNLLTALKLFCLRTDQRLFNILIYFGLLSLIAFAHLNIGQNKKHVRKFDIRRHVKQEMKEIRF